MAKNRVHQTGRFLRDVAATQPATPASGDPVIVGQIPGIALIAELADGTVSIQTDGIWNLSVKGENNAGNVAVAAGDILYYEAGQTPPINKDNVAGVRFGYALDPITSGSTATIRVKVGY